MWHVTRFSTTIAQENCPPPSPQEAIFFPLQYSYLELLLREVRGLSLLGDLLVVDELAAEVRLDQVRLAQVAHAEDEVEVAVPHRDYRVLAEQDRVRAALK